MMRVPPPAASRLWINDRHIPFLREDRKDAAEIQQIKGMIRRGEARARDAVIAFGDPLPLHRDIEDPVPLPLEDELGEVERHAVRSGRERDAVPLLRRGLNRADVDDLPVPGVIDAAESERDEAEHEQNHADDLADCHAANRRKIGAEPSI